MSRVDMRRRAPFVSLVFAFGVAVSSGNAHASSDTERAAAIFRQAQEAFGRKSYSAAAASFEEAALLAPHAAAWLDAGESWELGGNFARAAEDCDRALAVREISPPLRREAEARLARLERQIGTLDVRSVEPRVVTLDGASEISAPAKKRVSPGRHALVVLDRAGAKGRALDVDVPRGETVVVDLASTAIAPAPEALPHAEPARSEAQPSAASKGPPLATYIAFGAAAVATLTAIGFGASTLAARNDFTSTPTVAARDHFYTTRTITNVAWLVAGASATLGAIFWIALPQKNARKEAYEAPRAGIGIFVRDAGIVLAHETRF